MRLALLLTLLGCSSLRAENCGDVTPLCESAFTITIEPDGARAFAPGIYRLHVDADGVRVEYECVIREPGGEAILQCQSNLGRAGVTAVTEAFAVTSLHVKAPAARRVSVTLQALCPTRELVARTFEPAYREVEESECATCRTASATIRATTMMTPPPAGAFVICPDSGVSGDGG